MKQDGVVPPAGMNPAPVDEPGPEKCAAAPDPKPPPPPAPNPPPDAPPPGRFTEPEPGLFAPDGRLMPFLSPPPLGSPLPLPVLKLGGGAKAGCFDAAS